MCVRARARTYVRRSRQACVNFRFDEHDLVASRGPFNGISVLPKREILNFKTRIRMALSYSESVASAKDATAFWPTSGSAIKVPFANERRSINSADKLSILICNCVNYIAEYSRAFILVLKRRTIFMNVHSITWYLPIIMRPSFVKILVNYCINKATRIGSISII